MDIFYGDSKTAATTAIYNVAFSFYSTNEINQMNLVEIFCPAFFDYGKKVVEWGLCDLRMGTSTKYENCLSCGASYAVCPGHFGYIDLAIPVSNPLVKNLFTSLLESCCFYCNFFKISSWKIKLSYIKLLLFDLSLNIKKINLRVNQISFSNPNENLFFSYNIKIVNLINQKIEKNIYSNFFFDKVKKLQKNQSNFINFFLKKLSSVKCCQKCKKNKVYNYQKKFKFLFEKKNDYLSFYIKNTFNFVKKKNILLCSEKYIKFSSFFLEKKKFFFSFQEKKYLCDLWKYESDFCELIWGSILKSCKFKKQKKFENFFLNKLMVPPTRFRPIYFNSVFKNKMQILSNSQNFYFLKIVKLNQQLLLAIGMSLLTSRKNIIKKFLLDLEFTISCLFDSDFSSSSPVFSKNPIGIKQQLEKKMGLFRMYLMGKRVNFSARSVITSDPYLKTNEIGLPYICKEKIGSFQVLNKFNLPLFLKILLYKKNRNKLHFKMIETIFGKKINIFEEERKLKTLGLAQIFKRYFDYYICKRLKNFGLTKAFKMICSRDLVLVNRQPSLHKASIMAHKVVIRKKTKCLSLNYANCASYNADFDGDEMNLHIINNVMGKAEAFVLSLTHNHNRIPTNSIPIRCLIQDYIVSSVLLTKKDNFLREEIFFYLLNCLFIEKNLFLKFCFPAILKPRILWTGKQLFSMVIKNSIANNSMLFFESRNKMNKIDHGEDETLVLVRKGELLKGIIDSSQLGKKKHGILHALHEKYSSTTVDSVLTNLSFLLMFFQRSYGHTTGLNDLIISGKMDKFRTKGFSRERKLKKLIIRKILSKKGFFLQKFSKTKKIFSFLNIAGFFFIQENSLKQFIFYVKSILTKICTNTIENNFPENIETDLNKNGFLAIILSGSKGSFVNFFQICTNLGQMELEGNCVSRDYEFRVLPFFFPFEISCESNGFIVQRFLTGIDPPGYFFHSMAGRESLLDTTVKTAQSGYIQRSLIKHFEDVRLNYDLTIRSVSNEILQIIYFQTGLSSLNSDFNQIFTWYLQNLSPCFIGCSRVSMIKTDKNVLHILFKKLKNMYNPIDVFYRFKQLIYEKSKIFHFDKYISDMYQKNLYEPGEPVGIITSQSIGEPCTQMTLNSFHFAGKIALSYSTGIPRIKEILMTASNRVKNPTTSVFFHKNLSFKNYIFIEKRLKKIAYVDLIKTIVVYKNMGSFVIKIRLISRNRYKHQFLLKTNYIKNQFQHFFKKYTRNLLHMSDFHFFQIYLQKNTQILKIKFKKDLDNQKVDKKDFFFSITQSKVSEIYHKISKMFFFTQMSMIDFSFIDFKQRTVHFNGINFCFLWANADLLNINKIFTNDISEISLIYGIEASRTSIFLELETIFRVQAISINRHHIDLISDYMTKNGKIKSFSRTQMKEKESFQKISYETALNFITNAAINQIHDQTNSPSSSMCIGKVCNSGLGYFDLGYFF
nr:DNA-directed RNA polymerase I chain-like protein [Cryptomonas paramecium]